MIMLVIERLNDSEIEATINIEGTVENLKSGSLGEEKAQKLDYCEIHTAEVLMN